MATISSPRDGNNVPAILVTRSDDRTFPMNVYVVPSTHRMLVENGTSGSGSTTQNAERDSNFFPVLMAVSSVDGVTPVPIWGDFSTGSMLVSG